MKIKKGFMLKTFAGDNLVIAVGEAEKSFSDVVKLNETGVFLWNLIKTGSDIDALTFALQDEYSVEHEAAFADVKRFLAKLEEIQCLE
jgi:hypothetical protein